jgi:hypothetical protein
MVVGVPGIEVIAKVEGWQFSCGIFAGQEGSESRKLKNLHC